MSAHKRIAWYYRRYGTAATVQRVAEAFRRWLYLGRMVLFACPLPTHEGTPPAGITLERVDGDAPIEAATRARLLDVAEPDERAQEMRQRFAAGAELWLVRVSGELAGYGWTLRGRTMTPHFFTLAADEAHLFDFHVFPPFRGRGINVALTRAVIHDLGRRGARCAHLECGAWNRAQLRSLRKTPFTMYAEATKIVVFGRPFVRWHSGQPLTPIRQPSGTAPSNGPDAMTSSSNASAKLS